MIMRMAWRMYSTNSSALDPENLPIDDRFLRSTRRVLVDGVVEVWVQRNQVWDAAGVIAVPMGE